MPLKVARKAILCYHIGMPLLRQALTDLVTRGAQPFLTFAIVFFLGTLLLGRIVDPGRFPVRIGSEVLKVSDIEAQKETLLERQEELAANRDELTNLVSTPVYDAFQDLKDGHASLAPAFSALIEAAFAFEDADGSAAIDLTAITLEGETFRVEGVVSSIDGRSIPILASFVDALRESEAYASVSEPEYVRIDRDHGSVSPFSLTLSL